jgi:hypothetical protein
VSKVLHSLVGLPELAGSKHSNQGTKFHWHSARHTGNLRLFKLEKCLNLLPGGGKSSSTSVGVHLVLFLQPLEEARCSPCTCVFGQREEQQQRIVLTCMCLSSVWRWPLMAFLIFCMIVSLCEVLLMYILLEWLLWKFKKWFLSRSLMMFPFGW